MVGDGERVMCNVLEPSKVVMCTVPEGLIPAVLLRWAEAAVAAAARAAAAPAAWEAGRVGGSACVTDGNALVGAVGSVGVAAVVSTAAASAVDDDGEDEEDEDDAAGADVARAAHCVCRNVRIAPSISPCHAHDRIIISKSSDANFHYKYKR